LTAENDHFTGKLVEIFKQVNDEGVKQQLRLGTKYGRNLASANYKLNIVYLFIRLIKGINRSDYMQHDVTGDHRSLLQVEINTIASSFASLSTRIYEMYRDLEPQYTGSLPVNEALQNISQGLALAHNEFLMQRKSLIEEDKVSNSLTFQIYNL
jgi:hypothetical protein